MNPTRRLGLVALLLAGLAFLLAVRYGARSGEAPPGPPCPLCSRPVRRPRIRSLWFKVLRQTEGEPELAPVHESCSRREMFVRLGIFESDIRDAPREPPKPTREVKP